MSYHLLNLNSNASLNISNKPAALKHYGLFCFVRHARSFFTCKNSSLHARHVRASIRWQSVLFLIMLQFIQLAGKG